MFPGSLKKQTLREATMSDSIYLDEARDPLIIAEAW
ncbi:MAG: XdhC family protein, partial [Mesorhizobium sp.]